MYKAQKGPSKIRIILSICNEGAMSARNAYPSGHLVPSPFLGLAHAPIVDTRFLELVVSFFDFSP